MNDTMPRCVYGNRALGTYCQQPQHTNHQGLHLCKHHLEQAEKILKTQLT